MENKWYLGWTSCGLLSTKVPCLCRGVIGVNIDSEYAKKMQLKETSKEEYRKVIEQFDKSQK